MDDLISRAALLKSLNEQAPKPTTDDLYMVNLCIINAPAVDAMPVEWLRNEAKLLIESEDGFDKYIGETLKVAAKYWNLKNEGTK